MKLVVVIMGQDNLHDLKICYDSIKEADAIVYLDGGSKSDVGKWLKKAGFLYKTTHQKPGKLTLITNTYRQADPAMNGKQRNIYLEYLKKFFPGWWCLSLDCDEVLSDGGISTLKEDLVGIDKKEPMLISVKMRHLQYHFACEDKTKKEHFVPNRLFKVTDELFYPDIEHPVLQSKELYTGGYYKNVTLWHLPYARMRHVKSRYLKNLEHSTSHTKEFLDGWYRAHLFGEYPAGRFDPKELPSSLLRAYCIEPDELYFRGRGLENKHWQDAVDWRDFLKEQGVEQSVFEFGCGLGPRVYAMKNVGLYAQGLELSDWAVEHAMIKAVKQGDISHECAGAAFGMTLAYDVLEHIEEERLPVAIRNLKNRCEHKGFVLVSVPFLGDPNLTNDSTHKIFKPRKWWIKQFLKEGLEEIEVPKHWQYKHQLLLFKNA